MDNSFKTKLKNGETLIGTLITIGHPMVSEILSQTGFDWLFIDLEHTTIELPVAQTLLQSMKNNCSALIRVPWNDHVWIKRVLEIGCDGIIIPQIKSAKEAEMAIQSCKYPPEGIRGAGAGRAQKYGMEFNDYISSANDNIAVILQIEHIDAVNNIDEILTVKNIDGIIIGPYDLSGSVGVLGQVTHPKVIDAISTVKKACNKACVPIGIFAMDSDRAKQLIINEFQIIAVGTDASFLWHHAKNTLQNVQPHTITA